MKLASRISVLAVLYVSFVGAVFAAPAFHAGSPGPGHTKRQAERNVLRVTAEKLVFYCPECAERGFGE